MARSAPPRRCPFRESGLRAGKVWTIKAFRLPKLTPKLCLHRVNLAAAS